MHLPRRALGVPIQLPAAVVLMAHPRGFPAAAPDLSHLRALPWADEALCAETDWDLFFPDKVGRTYITIDGHREVTAKAICRRCPCRSECREYALNDPHLEGIWGATTERERIAIRAGRAL